jgi:hypothetical protein
MDTFFPETVSVCECGRLLVCACTFAHYNFSIKTNVKQKIKHAQEILTSGNAFAPFYITVQ